MGVIKVKMGKLNNFVNKTGLLKYIYTKSKITIENNFIKVERNKVSTIF